MLLFEGSEFMCERSGPGGSKTQQLISALIYKQAYPLCITLIPR